MITINQQGLKKVITDYLESDSKKNPRLVSISKSLLETIEEKETYDFIRNTTLKRQCYNCALKEVCEREHPNTYEPIGTCDKWENENGLKTLID